MTQHRPEMTWFGRGRHDRRSLLAILAMAAVLLGTSRLYPIDSPSTRQVAADSYSYLAIAQSVPALPTTTLLYQHAQRFVVPYVVGYVGKSVGLDLDLAFWFATLLALSVSVAAFWVALRRRISERAATVVLVATFLFCPYSHRLLIAFPGLVNDAVFVLGLCLLCDAILSGARIQSILAALLCALSRQSAMLLLPGLGYLAWKADTGKRTPPAVAMSLIVITYLLTAEAATGFGKASRNPQHLAGLIAWLGSPRGSVTELLAFLAKGGLAYVIAAPLAAFGLYHRRRRSIVGKHEIAFGLMWLGLVAQPILAGPEVTAGNTQRLMALGMAPLLLLIAPAFATAFAALGHVDRRAVLMTLAAALTSFHHVYSRFGGGPEDQRQFAVFQAAGLVMVVIALSWWSPRRPEPRDARRPSARLDDPSAGPSGRVPSIPG